MTEVHSSSTQRESSPEFIPGNKELYSIAMDQLIHQGIDIQEFVAIMNKSTKKPIQSLDDNLYNDLGMESIALLGLACEIENRYQIFLPEDDVPLNTAGDLLLLLNRALMNKDKSE